MTTAPAVPGTVSQHRFRAMASDVHVLVVEASGTPHEGRVPDVRSLLQTAVDRIAVLESTWSRFLPGSDVDRLNRAGGTPIAVAPETIVLLDAMRRGWELTEGRFDPTTVPSLVVAGYRDRRTGAPDRSLDPAVYVAAVGAGDLRVDSEHGTASIGDGVAIDPGGVGKGLAADLVVADLLVRGAAGALVGIGGDLAFGGLPPTSEGWVVDIEDPLGSDAAVSRFGVINRGGVATSSTRSNRWVAHDEAGRPETRHHVVDPATRSPSGTDLASVTVLAGTGWLAEVAATSLLLVGSGRLEAEAARLGVGPLEYLAVTDDGRRIASPGLTDGRALATNGVSR